MLSRVVHFEIQAENVERAKTFYAAVFGWTFQEYGQFTGSPYWGIVTGPDDEPGINGGLLQRPAATPAAGQGTNAFVCTVGVGDYDETERKVLAAGGQVAMPKTALTAWRGRATTSTPRATPSASHQPDPEAA